MVGFPDAADHPSSPVDRSLIDDVDRLRLDPIGFRTDPQPELATPGTPLTVEVLGKKLPAQVVAMPLYDPENNRMKS